MSSPVLPLTWHLARASGRRGLQSQVLAAAAAAVGALVLLLMVAACFGSGTRADRTAWRTPHTVSAQDATAVQTLTTTFVRHRPVTVVTLAQLPGRAATPAPPGLDRFPVVGHTYVSPALRRLMRDLPANQLAGRFQTRHAYGTLGSAGLASPDELVAVVGATSTSPAVRSATNGGDFDPLAAVGRVSGFGGSTQSLFASYDRPAAILGGVLLIVPVIVLASAAGRLGAARREQRLAALRLAGATPRQILAMTGVESAAVGLAGAATGALLYTLLLPLLAEVPYGVGSWYTGDLWVGLPWVLAVLTLVAALTAFSAVTSLRAVARSPLGVAQEANPRRTRVIRLVLFVVTVLYVAASAQDGSMKTGQQLSLLLLFYGAFWMVGPWVVDVLGRIAGRFARRPATLLAARRLSDDPRGAWRTVSGLVLAGFVAGFFSVGQIAFGGYDDPGQVAVRVPHGSTQVAADRARELLREAGVEATVRTSDSELLMFQQGVVAHVRGGQVQLDIAQTALSRLSPGNPPSTQDYLNADSDVSTRDIGQVGLAALGVGFLVAAASAGLTSAATVLDRRRIYGLLRLAGVDLKVLDRARLRETALPLAVLAGGTLATGVYAALQVNKMFHTSMNAAGTVRLGLFAAVGTALMFAALACSRPLLRRVTAQRTQDPD